MYVQRLFIPAREREQHYPEISLFRYLISVVSEVQVQDKTQQISVPSLLAQVMRITKSRDAWCLREILKFGGRE